MRNDFYPTGTVQHALETGLLTAVTKEVIASRFVVDSQESKRFFSKGQFETLEAICLRLIPQPDRDEPVNLPALIEQQLVSKAGNGWRYASLPADREAVLRALEGIEKTALSLYGIAFPLLDVVSQDAILQSIEDGTVEGETWETLPPALFFRDFMAMLVEIYYSQPAAKDEIGDLSFADAAGWKQIGLNQVETYEPLPIKVAS